jgi:NEDD8-activating enzyme E1 regulatory subunit
VSEFFQDHGVLPLPGTVPDMKAQSADYMELQTVYKSKARQDAAEVLQTVRKLEADRGRTNIVDEKEVEAFCKGAAHIKLIRGRPLHIVDDADSNVIALDWSDSARACGTLNAST